MGLRQAVRFRGSGKADQPGEVHPTFFTPRSPPHVPPNPLRAQPQGPPATLPGRVTPLFGSRFPHEMRGECPDSKTTPVSSVRGRGRPRGSLGTGSRGPAGARRAGGSAERGRRRCLPSGSAPEHGAGAHGSPRSPRSRARRWVAYPADLPKSSP